MQHAPQTGKKTIAVFLPFLGRIAFEHDSVLSLTAFLDGAAGETFFDRMNGFPLHVSMQHAPQKGKKTIAVFLPFWGALHLNTIQLYPLRLSWMGLQGKTFFGYKGTVSPALVQCYSAAGTWKEGTKPRSTIRSYTFWVYTHCSSAFTKSASSFSGFTANRFT